MHVVLDTGNGSKLWLGGSVSVDPHRLVENGVTVVWPAASNVQVPDTVSVKILKTLDGTGVVNGRPSFEQVLGQVDEVVTLLMQGHSVLIACHNGAHRSATLSALVLLRLTAASAQEVSDYLSSLRNIVDLQSRAPSNHHRRMNVKPMDYLESHVVSQLGDMVGKEHEIIVASRWANAALFLPRIVFLSKVCDDLCNVAY